MTRHIIWDWNCTLFDDFDALLSGTNVVVKSLGLEPLDADGYRTVHMRPLAAMYERLLDRPFTHADFLETSPLFLDKYDALIKNSNLRPDSLDCVRRVADLGITQSILSMWDDEKLQALTQKLSFDKKMVLIEGIGPKDIHTKEDHIRKHLKGINNSLGVSLSNNEITMIGDTVNDYEAASEVGIGIVLVTAGQDTEKELIDTGAPVTHSLSEALDVVLGS